MGNQEAYEAVVMLDFDMAAKKISPGFIRRIDSTHFKFERDRQLCSGVSECLCQWNVWWQVQRMSRDIVPDGS